MFMRRVFHGFFGHVRGALGRWPARAALAAFGLGLLGACGGGGGDSPPPAATLSTIVVTPAQPTVAKGLSQRFVATGTYSDGTTGDLTATATWASSNTTVASIDATGFAVAAQVGSATITAAAAGVSGSTLFTVAPAALVAITVTPGSATLGYEGATAALRATGSYTDQTSADITHAVAWSSSDAAVVAVAADGFAVARAVRGAATISARSGTLSASAALAVRTATLSGVVEIPASDMGWRPSIHDLIAAGGGKVRVLGTSLVTDVVPTGANSATFSLSGVPLGAVTLLFDEGAGYDVFTQASKRLALTVDGDNVAGAAFSFVYHWRELAGYPPPWGTIQSQGPVSWKAQFVSENIAFIAFRMDIPSERIELYRTLDRGASWTRVGQWIFDPVAWATGTWAYPQHWTNFHFLDAERGVLHATAAGIPCDSGGGYFQTANGGRSWTLRPLPLPPTGYHVQTSAYARIGDSHLLMAGRVGCGVQGYTAGFYDAIWESTNAGVDWQLRWHSPRDESGAFVGLDANAAGRAVAYRGGGIQGFVLRDVQGNWTTRAGGGLFNDSRDLAMVGDEVWMISSGGTLASGTYHSTDAGLSWSRISAGLPQDFDFVTSRRGFAQAGGPALATYDGGVTWRYQAAGGAIWPGVMDIWGFDRNHAAWAEIGFGDPNQRGQLFTYVEPAEAGVEWLQRACCTDADVARGSTDVVMAAYEWRNGGVVPAKLRSLGLRASGSGNDTAHVAAVKLWLDRNADGVPDTGDTLLASATFAADDGVALLNLADDALPALQTFDSVRLLVTYDLAGTGTAAGSYRFAIDMAAVGLRDADTGAAITAGAPAGYALNSRTIRVLP